MGFFNSHKSRMTRRGNTRSVLGQNKRMLREMTYKNVNGARIANGYQDIEVTVTKKQAEILDLGFTGHCIKNGDMMILGDASDMLPNYQHDIDPDAHNIIRNDVFEGIKADKIGLVYSPKLKQFLYLGLNDDYTISILFKSDNYHDLPNTENIDIDNLHPNMQVIPNINTMLNTVYNVYEVYDFCQNPLIIYKINEVFRKWELC